MLVAYAIPHRCAQICGERVPASKLECINVAKGAEDRVLDEVRCVGDGPHPMREPTMCPTAKLGKAATEKLTEGARITEPGSRKETPRCVRGRAARRSQRHEEQSPSAMICLSARSYMSSYLS